MGFIIRPSIHSGPEFPKGGGSKWRASKELGNINLCVNHACTSHHSTMQNVGYLKDLLEERNFKQF